jgi:lauroyl/myristoyl acyltransferase
MSALVIWVFGWLWWVVLPIRKRVAVANYARAFPERDRGELRRTVGEMVLAYIDLLRGVRARVEGAELLQGGVICLAGHFSAWDIGLTTAAMTVPTTATLREPANRLPLWVIRRVRSKVDLVTLPPKGSMAAAYDALERGRMVMLVQDQRYNQGIPVPFFGATALTSPGLAAIAWRTRRPIVGMWVTREDDGGYLLRFEPLDWPIPEDRETAIAELTVRSQQFYEEGIRRKPYSWLWLHDRWKGAGAPV